MANRLNVANVHSIQVLHQQGWSDRRIARELGVHRETVARYVRLGEAEDQPGGVPAGSWGPKPANVPAGSGASEASKPANVPAGSAPPASGQVPGGSTGPPGRCPSACRAHHAVIVAKLDQGLSAQRIWQDLRAEHGFAHAYDSVKRYVRKLAGASPLPFRRMECAPGEQAQVDFGRGAPIVNGEGRRRASHVFRIGYQAIKSGLTVLYRSIFDVVRDFLHEEAFEGADKVLARYLKPDLLIIDDMGMKQLPKRSGEYFFEVILRRHETRSTMMTSNRPLEDWGKLIGDVPSATAILDRFLHHAEIVTITGRSYRLKDRASRAGTAGDPLKGEQAATPAGTSQTSRKRRTLKTDSKRAEKG